MTGRIALVTRPEEDSLPLAAALERRGFAVLSEPLLKIVPRTNGRLALSGVQGYLATSANGVRALAVHQAPRGLPLWAVGDATAQTARRMGFSSVESAGGDAAALVRLVAAKVDPAAGALLHAAGTETAGDVSGALGALGFSVRREILYDAVAADRLSDGAAARLKAGGVALALFFSPRTARTFVTLATAAGCGQGVRSAAAYGLSPAVAEALRPLPWRRIVTAEHPGQESLLAAIDREEGI